jgi:hypothetical protein
MNINKVIIQDTNIPLNMDEFSEEFASIVIALLLDFFLGFD